LFVLLIPSPAAAEGGRQPIRLHGAFRPYCAKAFSAPPRLRACVIT
jgi:hypothetical protein